MTNLYEVTYKHSAGARRTQRAAHHVTGCAIASVERLEGGAA